MKILCALLALGSFPLSAAELVFKQRGAVVKTLERQDLLKISPLKEVTVYEPHENRERPYRGFPFREVLTSVYGDGWKKTEEVLLTCSDGYQAAVPIAKVLAHASFLAVETPESEKFTVTNRLQNNEVIEVGPYYLIWKNDEERETGVDWPYQVISVDLIRFADRYPRMAPPENSSAEVKKGFVAFRGFCMNCHTVNGEGGKKSIELNYPTSVTEMFKPNMLRRWIENPSGLRWNTTMPAFPETKNRAQAISHVILYLEAMAKHKQKPAE